MHPSWPIVAVLTILSTFHFFFFFGASLISAVLLRSGVLVRSALLLGMRHYVNVLAFVTPDFEYLRLLRVSLRAQTQQTMS
jgi:hypothetical protein